MIDYLDPTLLGIVPPMDLNSGLPGNDFISPIPMELRTRSGVGLFGTRRDAGGNGLIRMHEGVDLLAKIGTKVFAVASGKVIGGSATSILLQHDIGYKFLTFYQHIRNKTVADGDSVTAGQHIAEVGNWSGGSEDHLHFEIRYPFDTVNPSRSTSLPVDPTMALYHWEEKSYQNDAQVRNGHIFDNVFIVSIEEVRRARLLRFLLVNIEGDSRDLFIPLHATTPFVDSMIDSIKEAFSSSKKVRLVWRDSLFFKNIQSTNPTTSIIAEVKVYK